MTDSWASVKAFTICLLFALQNGSNNRNRVKSQCLSLVNSLGNSHGSSKEIVMARTKMGDTLSKGLRDLHYPPFWDKGDITYVQKGSLWVKIQGIITGHNESCSSRSLHFEIHLAEGLHAHPLESPRVGQMWENKQDNWFDKRQRPVRTDLYKWLNHLFTALLLTEEMPTHFLSRCVSLPCLCLN